MGVKFATTVFVSSFPYWIAILKLNFIRIPNVRQKSYIVRGRDAQCLTAVKW